MSVLWAIIHTSPQCTQPAVLFMQEMSECPATTLAETKTFQWPGLQSQPGSIPAAMVWKESGLLAALPGISPQIHPAQSRVAASSQPKTPCRCVGTDCKELRVIGSNRRQIRCLQDYSGRWVHDCKEVRVNCKIGSNFK